MSAAPSHATSPAPERREATWDDGEEWSNPFAGFYNDLLQDLGVGPAAGPIPESLRAALRDLPNARQLWLSEVDESAAFKIADALEPGHARRLEMMRLGKLITADGCAALAEALGKGGASNLQALHLSGNLISDDGASAIAFDMLRRGGVPRLRDLQLNHCGIGDTGAAALGEALRDGAGVSLQNLWLGGNAIGDYGVEAFAAAITPQIGQALALRRLALYTNNIGDRGAVVLARAVETRRQERKRAGGLATLTIMLWSNKINDPDTERLIIEVDAAGRAEDGDWIELNRSPHHYSPSANASCMPSTAPSPHATGMGRSPDAGTPWSTPPKQVQSRYGMY